MADFVAADEARIAFEAVGSGPALVLMHGAEASRQMFGALVPLLAPHFTVIVGSPHAADRAPGSTVRRDWSSTVGGSAAITAAHCCRTPAEGVGSVMVTVREQPPSPRVRRPRQPSTAQRRRGDERGRMLRSGPRDR